MNDKYELNELASLIEVDAIHVESMKALNKRMTAAYEETYRNWNTDLYGDQVPPRRFTRRELWARRIRTYWRRVTDAWLVLRGKVDIGDY